MVNYVTTVLVGNGKNAVLTAEPTSYNVSNIGKFMVMNMADGKLLDGTTIESAEAIKIGIVTKESYDAMGKKLHNIKWSNVIKRNNLKSFNFGSYVADTKESVAIDFSQAASSFFTEGKRIVVRITYKDIPARLRKWTESYEYVCVAGDDATKVADKFAELISVKNYKRARVTTNAAAGVLTLTAMDYDDDDSNDTINVDNTVRFACNVYYTDTTADWYQAKNKYTIPGVTITKTPGKKYTASAKLVRDREAWAMGYQGILNRGECTWPIIKPSMAADITKQYDYAIVEFETMYRAADDIQRYTKECLEVYEVHSSKMEIKDLLDKWINGNSVAGAYATSVAEAPTKAKQG